MRPRHADVDEVAVDRCAAGTLHHTALSWVELEQVVRRLERWLTDTQIDQRLGAAKGLVQTTRRRRGWPRQAQPPARGLAGSELRAVLTAAGPQRARPHTTADATGQEGQCA